MHYDPAPDLSRIACPVLAITGRSDVQVDCRDVEQMGRTVCSEFTGYTPEHLTHLLRIDAGPPGLCTYPAQMRRPVDAGALNVISAWLGHRLARAVDATLTQESDCARPSPTRSRHVGVGGVTHFPPAFSWCDLAERTCSGDGALSR